MAVAPIFYQNSPVAGTEYFAPMWAGCIPNNGTSVTVTVKTFSGANGGGSLVSVTNLTAVIWNQTGNAQVSAFTQGSGNTANVTSAAGSNGTNWIKPAGKYGSGAGVGSLGIQITSYTGQAWIPAITSISATAGPVGSTVTLTGSKFTDATSVTLGGVACAFTINSDTSITVTIPSGVASGVFTVSNPAGSGSSAATFTVSSIYVMRSGVWKPAAPQVERTGVQTLGTAFVFRTGAWVQGK